MEIAFTVYGEPKGKARPRFVRTGRGVRTYTPKQTETYQNDVLCAYLNKYKGTTLKGPIWARIDAYFTIPKSTPKYKRPLMHWYDKKPDVDNIAKSILDALNGTAYDDDKQVVALVIYKEYADIARVNVMLGELNDDGRREDSGDREGRA